MWLVATVLQNIAIAGEISIGQPCITGLIEVSCNYHLLLLLFCGHFSSPQMENKVLRGTDGVRVL